MSWQPLMPAFLIIGWIMHEAPEAASRPEELYMF